MGNAERLQWISLALGVAAILLIVPQMVGLAPFYLAAGAGAIVCGITADSLASKTGAAVVLPARIAIAAGIPPVGVALILFATN